MRCSAMPLVHLRHRQCIAGRVQPNEVDGKALRDGDPPVRVQQGAPVVGTGISRSFGDQPQAIAAEWWADQDRGLFIEHHLRASLGAASPLPSSKLMLCHSMVIAA